MGGDPQWRLLCVTVPQQDSDVVADYLWSRGVAAIEEINKGEFVELRTSYGSEVEELSVDVSTRFPQVIIEHVEILRGVADTWRDFAEPVVIDATLRIVPSWTDQSVSHSENIIDILIDPEDVFGLGNHPTTIGALRLARRHAPHHSTVLDFGAGSGVLAISMAKTHHCCVSAFDIADNSREVVSRNAERNDVDISWIDLSSQHSSNTDNSYDVILANILAPVLCDIAPVVKQLSRKGTAIILAGMRDEQWENVHNHYQWCEFIESISIEGWTSVCLRMS